ncbi:MAG TPA: T9SS type A sorting domain-containing protein [Chitinophagaceae bacterium]|jgi:hypothetical protein|nr:T9SS type A sorting domain-containing protein [Chitinophagaceae bacterium]
MKRSVHSNFFQFIALVLALFLLVSVATAQTTVSTGIPVKCGECSKESVLETCTNCKGAGAIKGVDCGNCKGSGMLHSECDHAWDGSMSVIPEMVFRAPKLVSGTAGKQGAVYRFANVSSGIDVLLTLKTFSSPSITLANLDRSDLGWDKAFQPEFGMTNVKANDNWYIDFVMNFVEAGTNTPKELDRFSLTSLDVDGDNVNVKEYVTMQKATSVEYSKISYLQNVIDIVLPTCQAKISNKGKDGEICGKQSAAIGCVKCLGTGQVALTSKKKRKCTVCNGVGKVHSLCLHPFSGVDATVKGPQDNFTNIDTAATQVMATYVYNNVETISFRIGATSGNRTGGAGVRLNSMWFKAFSLAPAVTLPVKLHTFAALYNEKDVTLTWNTSEEIEFSHFVVERSTDGKNFTELATVFSAGNGTGMSQYAYKDKNVSAAPGVYYYRIRMVDLSAEFTYSAAKVVRTARGSANGLTIATFPNPVTDQVRISLPQSWQGKAVALELFNANGSRVQSLQVAAASQTETLNVAGVAKGFYIVKVSCAGATAQERIVKH